MVVLVTIPSLVGCQRAVRRFAGSAAGGVVDRVIAQPDSTVELLETELRWMEDNLYRLDDELDSVLLQLDSARRDNAVLRLELSEARGENQNSAQKKSVSFDNYSEEIDLSPPVVVDQKSVLRRDPAAEPNEDDSFVEPVYENGFAPKIIYGTPSLAPSASELNRPEPVAKQNGTEANASNDAVNSAANSGDNSANDAAPNDEAPETAQNNTEDVDTDSGVEEGVRLEAMPEPQFSPPSEPIDIPKPDPFESRFKSYRGELQSVFRIKLNPRLTGGYNFDDKPGHEGVMVVIEPQNKDAQYVPVTGAITIEVNDLAKSGLAGRVGKWKFDSIDAQKHLKQTAFGKGVHLQLPWPGAPPENRDLEVTVSYQLANGRTLIAKKSIRIEPLTSVLASKANATGQDWSPTRPPPKNTRIHNTYPSAATRPSQTPWLPNR